MHVRVEGGGEGGREVYDAGSHQMRKAVRLSGWEADVTQGGSRSVSIRLTSPARTSV